MSSPQNGPDPEWVYYWLTIGLMILQFRFFVLRSHVFQFWMDLKFRIERALSLFFDGFSHSNIDAQRVSVVVDFICANSRWCIKTQLITLNSLTLSVSHWKIQTIAAPISITVVCSIRDELPHKTSFFDESESCCGTIPGCEWARVNALIVNWIDASMTDQLFAYSRSHMLVSVLFLNPFSPIFNAKWFYIDQIDKCYSATLSWYQAWSEVFCTDHYVLYAFSRISKYGTHTHEEQHDTNAHGLCVVHSNNV